MQGVVIACIFIFCLAMERVVGPIIRKKRLRKQLRAAFGRLFLREIDADAMQDIASYYKEKTRDCENPRAVDDITWNDLEMDEIYRRLDAMQSDAGEEVFYAMLREIDASENALARRGALIHFFQQNEEARTELAVPLAMLGKNRHHGSAAYLFHADYRQPGNGLIYIALAIAPLLSLLLCIISINFLFVFGALFFVNLIVFYKMGRVWQSELLAIRHLSAVINCAKQICRLDIHELQSELHQLSSLVAELKPILSWNAILGMEPTSSVDFLTVYIKIMFQTDMISLCRIASFALHHMDALQKIYQMVGEFDALIGIASIHTALKQTTMAEIWTKSCVDAENMTHPLIKNAVSNSIAWERDILITGSNASGKSTFTKAMAINAIFAQSICIVWASRFSMPRAQVMTSMAVRDNLLGGESYFVAEIKSIKRILDAVRSDITTLCFIDEILRGTNTVERISASTALLRYLNSNEIKGHALLMAATHDVELTKLLENSYDMRHFREEMSEEGMTFTYRLMDGPSNTRNAIALLKQMGFPGGVTHTAEALAANFDAQHIWQLTTEGE